VTTFAPPRSAPLGSMAAGILLAACLAASLHMTLPSRTEQSPAAPDPTCVGCHQGEVPEGTPPALPESRVLARAVAHLVTGGLR